VQKYMLKLCQIAAQSYSRSQIGTASLLAPTVIPVIHESAASIRSNTRSLTSTNSHSVFVATIGICMEGKSSNAK
jgi:hypothetical protein